MQPKHCKNSVYSQRQNWGCSFLLEVVRWFVKVANEKMRSSVCESAAMSVSPQCFTTSYINSESECFVVCIQRTLQIHTSNRDKLTDFLTDQVGGNSSFCLLDPVIVMLISLPVGSGCAASQPPNLVGLVFQLWRKKKKKSFQ